MKSKKKPNPIAKEVRTPKFRQKIVKAKKGKGSYTRTTKVSSWPVWFGSWS
tara:strand:- start:64 stop:216 length:153 start_codon:yes stop_codon:yes gene_type:complete